jgi:predicted enzyme related to lactoylglutathione lyase
MIVTSALDQIRMDDFGHLNLLTRRSALMLGAAASPLFSQSGDKLMGRPVVHFEIGCADRAKTAQYFSALFGWKMQADGPATNIDTVSQGGIAGHLTSLGHAPFHYTIFYVDVEDVKASLDKAVELGGKALVGPITIPAGTFGWFADPDGNTIGLLKPAR